MPRLGRTVSRREGCINYESLSITDNPALFIFTRIEKNRGEIERHLGDATCSVFDERTEGMLAEPEEITMCEMIS